jgi:alkylated DNA nucleotide flippase Atl1
VLGEHFGASNNSAFTSSGSNTPSFLASTGADIAELVGIALLAIGVGTVMRRRRHDQSIA